MPISNRSRAAAPVASQIELDEFNLLAASLLRSVVPVPKGIRLLGVTLSRLVTNRLRRRLSCGWSFRRLPLNRTATICQQSHHSLAQLQVTPSQGVRSFRRGRAPEHRSCRLSCREPWLYADGRTQLPWTSCGTFQLPLVQALHRRAVIAS